MNYRENENKLVGLIPWLVAVMAVSATLALLIGWRAPGLELYARDALMRARGHQPASGDIVIVAIDEASLKRFGRFPWPRSVMARALDQLRAAKPRAIALNILHSDPTDNENDSALAAAIARAGNVVAAAQLITDTFNENQTVWLRPIAEIERAAAGVGHVNVYTGFDGVARTLLPRQSDDDARSLWAMAIELIRIGDGLPADAVRERPDAVMIGDRAVPISVDPANLTIESEGATAERQSAARLMIDYIGPAGSFAPQTIGIGDLIDGRVPAERLRGKYVLIGATAAGLGERFASPFVHGAIAGQPRSQLIPGVEALANQVNTILRQRFYRETPDWLALICAALVAAAVLIFAAAARGSYEIPRQIAALALLLMLILLASYLAFSKLMVLPPVVPMLVAFAVATPLALLRRTWRLSREIDARIAELSIAGEAMLPAANRQPVARSTRWHWPRGADWKARELRRLNQQLVERALFVDRAMRSVEDGLIIASADGRIVFANPPGARILGLPERALMGGNLLERIHDAESARARQASTLISRLQSAEAARETLRRLLDDRQPIERELALDGPSGNTRHYTLRLSTVSDSTAGNVYGIVAAFTDITRHRELQRTQRDVMALVTHEMKTPLTAIQGMSEVLAQFDIDQARRREMHLTINDEAKRLARMIDEYLDLTRLESGARPLRLGPLRVEQIVERALLLLDPMAERRGIKLIRDFAAELPPMLGDADLISRAVANLADNAIKFSPANSSVRIRVRADETMMTVDVADHGSGIAPEFLPRIFEKFYRVPRLADVDAPGTGLGLAMVREVAELHGGRVTVESKAGAGSVFSLHLPIQTP